ncbi:MAG: anti-sigma factor [Alphaproteobacteria bacterium]|jgi:anti-sigma factor RsiW|nr:anti-sigma factor [Alphaproteobacteria bacterium]MBT7941944.1 anti-sigma factor [Alphaproteobacteria bacterium]
MTAPDDITQDDLNAFADGRLSPSEQTRVESWLAEHPDDAAAVHAYRLQNTRLHEEFDSVLDEDIPPALAAMVSGPSGRQGAPSNSWMRMAASILLLLTGGLGGWLLHGGVAPSEQATPTAFVKQAMGAHRVFVSEVRHPVEVPATQEAHLVGWLSKRLGTKLRAPNLQDAGYSLVGGRLLAEGARPAAQFMFEEKDGQRLTVYVRSFQDAKDTSFRFVSNDGVSAFYWVDKAFAYALIAPTDRARLLDIANTVYGTLNRP